MLRNCFSPSRLPWENAIVFYATLASVKLNCVEEEENINFLELKYLTFLNSTSTLGFFYDAAAFYYLASYYSLREIAQYFPALLFHSFWAQHRE